jgi:hypothetical protein
LTITSPIDDPESWDTLVIGGLSFTGAFEFGGDLLTRKLDRRHSAGRDGARIRDRGYDLAEITLTLRLWESKHFEQLDALVRLLFPRGADPTRRAAYSCAHPALALAGITEVYAKKMGSLTQGSPTLWTTEISLVEYRAEAQQAGRSRSRTVQQRPDLGANATAFSGTEAVPPAAATPPSAAGAADPD